MKRKKILKIVAWFSAIFILIAGILFSFGYFFSPKIIKSYLTEAVKKESKGMYQLEMGSLSFNVLSGNLTFNRFSLIPDTSFYRTRPHTDNTVLLFAKVNFDKIQIKGFRVFSALMHRRIKISSILFSGTEITVYRLKIPSKQSGKKAEEKIGSIPLPKGLNSIEIGELIIRNAKLGFVDCSSDSIMVNSIPTCDILIKHILVDSTRKEKTRIFNADDISIRLGAFSLPMRNGMNKLSFGEIGFSTASSELYINDFHLEPLYSKFDYTRKLGFQTDWADVTVRKLALRRIDLRALLFEDKIIVGLVEIDSAILNDYRDKRIALKPGFKPPMPQDGFRKLKTYLRVDTVLLKNGRINYEEQTGKVPGTLFFDKVDVTLTGLTNDSVLLKAGLVSELKGTLYLMGTGKIDALFRFHLSDMRNTFSFSARMGPFDLVEVNPMVCNLMAVKVVSGKVNKAIIPLVNANDDFAKGTMLLYYNDLSIDIRDKEHTTWSKIKTGVIGWVVNDLVISDDNPDKSGVMKTGTIYARRKKELGFPNFLWVSVFSGLKSTVGGVFSANLDADMKARGNFSDQEGLNASGLIAINDFHFGKNPDDDYAAFDKLVLAMIKISPKSHQYIFDSVSLTHPFLKYERYDYLDNVQTLFGKSGATLQLPNQIPKNSTWSFTSYHMNRGTIEINGAWKVRDGMIHSNNHVLIIDPRRTKRIKNNDKNWLPLPLIMSLIRERGNVIDYEIPV